MPDQRSVMKEFRFLDEKRLAGGLTPAEEARHAQLRALIGPEMGAGGIRGGFDVNAAAARLRDSLLPAGLRNRPPPPPEPAPEPEAPFAEPSPAEALASAAGEEPPGEGPGLDADALFDPASLDASAGPETDPYAAAAYDPDAQAAVDPNASYDPNAQPAWDPNVPYDPSVQAAWDPNAVYDPNAQPAWDPSAPYDPDAQAALDPNAPLDPNAEPAWDPNVPYDPDAQAALDPNAPLDPNAEPAWDPNVPYDPNAQAVFDPNAPLDPNAEPAWDPNVPYDPNAQAVFDPNAPLDPSAEPAWDPNVPSDPDAQAVFDPNAPLDPSAEPAWDPNVPSDPDAQAVFDPNAPLDPTAEPAWDPNVPSDPDAQAVFDPNAPLDPSAEPAWEPGAQPPWEAGDPNAPYEAPPEAGADEGAALEPGAEPGEVELSAAPYADEASALAEAPPGHGESAGGAVWEAPDAALDPTAAAWETAALDGSTDETASLDAEDAPAAGEARGLSAEWDTARQDGIAAAAADLPLDAEALDVEPVPDEAAPAAWDTGAADPSLEVAGERLEAGGDALDADGALGTAEPFHADGSALPPAGWDAEPEPLVPHPAPPEALGEYDETAVPPLVGEDAGLEPVLPFDPGAASAPEAAGAPGAYGTLGEYDDTAGFAGAFPEAAPPDLAQDASGFQAAQAFAPGEADGWAPEAALDDGFQLESGGSFDVAPTAAPEWAAPASAPWEPPAAEPLAAEDAPGVAPDAPFLEADAFAADVAALHDTALEGAESPAAPEALDLSAVEAAAPAEELDVDFGARAADLGPAPVLDFSRPDFSEEPGEPQGLPAEASAPPEPALDFSPPSPPEAGADAAAPPALEGASPGEAAAAEVDLPLDDDIPTIDGEEILEEIPLDELTETPAVAAAEPPAVEPVAPAAAAAPAAPPAPRAAPVDPAPEAPVPPAPVFAPPPPPPAAARVPAVPPPPAAAAAPAGDAECRVAGVHRVVVHTVEGQVKRGVLEDAALDATSLALAPQPGGAAEEVPVEKVKAIFFMLSAGEKSPVPEGKKVRVTFRDGRQVAGFSPDYRESGPGFFMIPADTRTNTGRIWVYRAAVRQVAVS